MKKKKKMKKKKRSYPASQNLAPNQKSGIVRTLTFTQGGAEG